MTNFFGIIAVSDARSPMHAKVRDTRMVVWYFHVAIRKQLVVRAHVR